MIITLTFFIGVGIGLLFSILAVITGKKLQDKINKESFTKIKSIPVIFPKQNKEPIIIKNSKNDNLDNILKEE